MRRRSFLGALTALALPVREAVRVTGARYVFRLAGVAVPATRLTAGLTSLRTLGGGVAAWQFADGSVTWILRPMPH